MSERAPALSDGGPLGRDEDRMNEDDRCAARFLCCSWSLLLEGMSEFRPDATIESTREDMIAGQLFRCPLQRFRGQSEGDKRAYESDMEEGSIQNYPKTRKDASTRYLQSRHHIGISAASLALDTCCCISLFVLR